MNVLLSVVLAAVATGDKDDKPVLDKDLQKLQGMWEMRLQQGDVQVRVVKELKGVRETLQTYRNEKLIHEHAADISIVVRDEVKIFRWTNGENLFGERVGQKMPDGACIVRINDDEVINVFGMLRDDVGPIRAERYVRVK